MSDKRPQDETTSDTFRFYLTQLKDEEAVKKRTVSSNTTQQKRSLKERIQNERVRREQIANDSKEDDQRLKRSTLSLLFIFLGGETVVVFVIAFLQGLHAWDFALDEWSMRLLVGATLIQTVSMLTIAIHHLFPKGDK